MLDLIGKILKIIVLNIYKYIKEFVGYVKNG